MHKQVEKRCDTGGRGHSFRWFNNGGSTIYGDRYSDPPADTECSCCPKTWAEIGHGKINELCPGAWAQHRDRLAFTKALQSPGGQL